jgi:RNA polymerase sigma factor (sigma-70 family)
MATTPLEPRSASPDADALSDVEESYVAHLTLMSRVAVRKFGISAAEAEPLVHDVFATFMLQSAEVRNVTAYLVGAMCNACRQYLRRSNTESALFCGEDPCAATLADDVIEEIHRKETLRRVLRRSGKKCRDLLHRYYIEEQSTKDIAAAYDTTPGTIQVFLHNCRDRARKACEKERY